MGDIVYRGMNRSENEDWSGQKRLSMWPKIINGHIFDSVRKMGDTNMIHQFDTNKRVYEERLNRFNLLWPQITIDFQPIDLQARLSSFFQSYDTFRNTLRHSSTMGDILCLWGLQFQPMGTSFHPNFISQLTKGIIEWFCEIHPFFSTPVKFPSHTHDKYLNWKNPHVMCHIPMNINKWIIAPFLIRTFTCTQPVHARVIDSKLDSIHIQWI